MRNNTGTVEAVFPDGTAKIQTNRNSLYSPCSTSMCKDNVVIDAVNLIGAKKGEYVEFTIPDDNMVAGAVLCFGLPLLLMLVCAAVGRYVGVGYGYDAQNSAICGFLAGVPLAVTAIKTYDLMMKPKGPKSKIIKLVEEE